MKKKLINRYAQCFAKELISAAKQKKTIWQVKCLLSNYEWEGELVAHWEVGYSAISDDYLPKETNAEELFYIWVNEVEGKYENDLIPIYWGVWCEEQKKSAPML